jgi:hypothetical protein
MPYPNTDFPSAIDAAVNRVDAVDIVWADDFNYPDEQVRTVQDYLGIESFPNLPAFFRTIGATRCIAELGDPPVSCGYFRFDPTRRPSVNIELCYLHIFLHRERALWEMLVFTMSVPLLVQQLRRY